MNESKPLGFAYRKTGKRFVAEYRDGHWDAGHLTAKDTVTLSESACVLQYAQTCFEGLKAYRLPDGRVVCFRPDLNAARLNDSCVRMVMPTLPEGMFLDALDRVVKANRQEIPDCGTGSLYLRPYVFGKDAVLGVKPATEFEFRMFASPVGGYFNGDAKALHLRITDFDRAAPHGTGHIKAGLNYAMSLYAITDAHAKGYNENVYLDAATRTYIEETGGANIIFITKNGNLVTPKSDSILPSITRRSLLYVAEHYLGIKAEERLVRASELADFDECGLCGTAAVISPVGIITDHGRDYTFRTAADKPDSVIAKLYETLTGIQHGTVEAPAGWLREICRIK